MAGAEALRRARASTRTLFFCLGGMFGLWGAHVPAVKLAHRLSDGGLASLLLAAALGSGAMLLLAGTAVQRLGPRQAVRLSLALVAMLMPLLMVLPGLPTLLPTLFLIGSAWTLCDVAINTEASRIEHEGGLRVMSGFHGMFSLGGMACAAAASGLLQHDVGAGWQFGLGAPTLGLLGLVASLGMLPPAPSITGSAGADPTPSAGESEPVGEVPLSRMRRLPAWVPLGVLGAVAMLAEGAMYDWSALFVQQELQTSAATAALAYASFSAAMAITRLTGDWLRAHASSYALLGAGGALTALAMGLTLLQSDPLWAIVGFAGVGIGLGNAVPLLFAEAARLPGVSASHAIAGVSGVSFLGFVGGPPVIGALAQASSLRLALLPVLLAALSLTVMSIRLGRRAARQANPKSN